MIEARTAGRRSGLLLASIVLMGAGLFILVLTVEAGSLRLGAHNLGSSFELAAAGLGIMITAIILWWARRRRRFDPFELPVWFSANAYGQVVLNVWILQRDLGFRPFVAGMATSSTPVAAILLMAVGLLALWAGYGATIRLLHRRPHQATHGPRRPRWQLIVALWFASTAVEALSVVAGASGYLSIAPSIWTSYIAFAGHLGALAAFVLLLQHFREPRPLGWLWLFTMLVTNVGLGLVVGTKSAVFVLLDVVMAIYYVRRRLSSRWLAVGFVAMLLVVPTVNAFRANLYAAGFDRSFGAGFGDRVPILLSSLNDTFSHPLSGLAEQTRDTLERRQGSLLEIMVAILAIHPNLRPFVGLDMLADFAQQAIPRVLWPGKPAGHPELYLILSSYLGIPDHSWASPGQFGDAYRAGGWLAVVAWFCLLGGLMAWFYDRGPGSDDMAGTAFYLLVLTAFLTYEYDIMRTTLELLKFGILLWLASRYLLFAPARDNDRPRAGLRLLPAAGARRDLPRAKGSG